MASNSVLRRLGSGQSDIARFCFSESVARIRHRDAYRLLLALALFEQRVRTGCCLVWWRASAMM